MGLDMFILAKSCTYTSYNNYGKSEGLIDETNYPSDLKKLGDLMLKNNFKSVETTKSYQIGYFRKFNALHSYIVQNFADGVDECQDIQLTKENCTDILVALTAVFHDHDKASEILPTKDGFFFGSTKYDDWYFEDIETGITTFQAILQSIDFNKYDVIYQASW